MRQGGFVAAALANAGTIASRKGKAMAVPRPLKNVRLSKLKFITLLPLRFSSEKAYY
jgi:hypothetical protein